MSKTPNAMSPADREIGPQTSSQQIKNITATRTLAQIAVFSGLVAFGTAILSTSFLAIPLPYPLYEITAAPAFYFAISVLYSKKVSFWSTAIGSAIGEALSVFVLNPSAGNPIFVPGIVWARAPEALIIHRFRKRSVRGLTLSMTLATIYETLAFYVPDSLFYAYALFSYSSTAQGVTAGFVAAFSDIGTLIDLVWIPVAMGLVAAARRAFKTDFLD